MEYTTKDSGKRVEYESGFKRDIQEGKTRYDLVPHEMTTRVADIYTRGAEKYTPENWRQAETEEELKRFKASAYRHFMQWFRGDEDEDHASAVVFNIFSYEWLTKYKPKKDLDNDDLEINFDDLESETQIPRVFCELNIGGVFNSKSVRYYKNTDSTAIIVESALYGVGKQFNFEPYDEIVCISLPIDN